MSLNLEIPDFANLISPRHFPNPDNDELIKSAFYKNAK